MVLELMPRPRTVVPHAPKSFDLCWGSWPNKPKPGQGGDPEEYMGLGIPGERNDVVTCQLTSIR